MFAVCYSLRAPELTSKSYRSSSSIVMMVSLSHWGLSSHNWGETVTPGKWEIKWKSSSRRISSWAGNCPVMIYNRAGEQRSDIWDLCHHTEICHSASIIKHKTLSMSNSIVEKLPSISLLGVLLLSYVSSALLLATFMVDTSLHGPSFILFIYWAQCPWLVWI